MTATHYDTSAIRLNQAVGQAFWLVDHQWSKLDNAPAAVVRINEFWTGLVEAIRNDTECEPEAKISRLQLLIWDIKRERI